MPVAERKLISIIITWFERIVIAVLILLMASVVSLATAELAWSIIQDIINIPAPTAIFLELDELLNIFGIFLLVLIGIELVETIKVFYTEQIIRVEVVLLVGIIAIARKVIVLNLKETSSLTLIGIGVIVIALTAGYFLIRRSHSRPKSDG